MTGTADTQDEMRVLGMLGGMAWPSTLEYYRLINEEIRRLRGGVHSAPLIVFSFDFAEIERIQSAGDWDRAGKLLADAAGRLEAAGAEGILLCTNTMHRIADVIEAATAVPLLHIADTTARAIRDAGLDRVGLLGTRFTMEQDFYRGRLTAHGIEVLVPGRDQRDLIHRVIYEELVIDVVRDDSRIAYLDVIADLERRGAQGIIAGCTEIELLVGPADIALPYFPTTRLHALAAAQWIAEVGRDSGDQTGGW